MTRKNPPAQWVLPDVVNPPDSICITVPVPNDRKHIGAFYGALFNLTSARFWQDDLAHTAREVALVWRAIFDELVPGACDFNVPDLIDDMEYQMSICEQLRFQNGKLQGLCCGEWVDIAGQTLTDIGGPDQQGDGADQPGVGECTVYHATFPATSTYLLPTVVNAGDTLEFSGAEGAGHDGGVSPWHCPDGSTFFAGGCVGSGGPSGTDPAPAINHMALIALIDGTYYEASSGTITVPGGVVNAEVVLQVNDSALGDNSGSYVVDVEVCNNATATWERILNLTLNDYGFVGSSFPGYDGGVWTPGAGWEATDEFDGSNWARHLQIQKTWASGVTLTYQEWDYTVVRGPELVALDDSIRSNGTDRATHNNSSGTFAITYSTPQTGQTSVGFNCYVSQQALQASLSGQVQATRVVLRGLGTPPF
jgi:hypothetical protein